MDQTVKTPSVTKIDLQVARSDLIDAFAGVEAAIIRLEVAIGLKRNNSSLGQRIARLRKSDPIGGSVEWTQLLDQLQEINLLRTEIVHRAINIVALHGTTKALFIDQSPVDTNPPAARVWSLQNFEAEASKLRSLNKAITDRTP